MAYNRAAIGPALKRITPGIIDGDVYRIKVMVNRLAISIVLGRELIAAPGLAGLHSRLTVHQA